MRPPRHRFSEEVRSATRDMAARMVREGGVPDTPERLDAWIAAAPDARATLERGGYGRDFTADDLLPLLHVFAGTDATARPVVPAKAPSMLRLALGLLVLVALGVLFALLAGGARGRSDGAGAAPPRDGVSPVHAPLLRGEGGAHRAAGGGTAPAAPAHRPPRA